MKKNEPFVALPRSAFDTLLWNEPRPMTRMEAYIDLLQSASYHPYPTIRSTAGRTVTIRWGETIAATRYLAERWKWTRANVRTFIHCLERLALVNIRTEKRIIILSFPSQTNTPPEEHAQTSPNPLHNLCTSNDLISSHFDTATDHLPCTTSFTNLAQNKEEEKEKQLTLITDENNDDDEKSEAKDGNEQSSHPAEAKKQSAAPESQEAAPNVLQASPENQEADPSEVKKSERTNASPAPKPAKPPKTVRTSFRPPTTDEIAAYCLEKGITDVDPDTFYDYYEAKGWLIGRTKMRDWRAALRNWHRREAAHPRRYPPLPTNGLLSLPENISLLKAHTLPLPSNAAPMGENTIYHANHCSHPLPPLANNRPPYPLRTFSPSPFNPSADASGRSALEAVRALEMRRLGCIARMDEAEPIF